jgi:type 1 fimbria pilin
MFRPRRNLVRHVTTFLAVLAVSVLGFAPAASAAGQLCYDVNINIQGNAVAQADCVEV